MWNQKQQPKKTGLIDAENRLVDCQSRGSGDSADKIEGGQKVQTSVIR